jgi:hypothetical protein
MPRRSRLRRIAKWTGLAVCVVLALLWGGSLFATVEWVDTLGEERIAWGSGRVLLTLQDFERIPICARYSGFHELQARWSLSWWWSSRRISATIPLWLPFLLVALPTAFLFYRDRRRPGPNHCQQCGYNLTGNLSGTCPECGMPVTRESNMP